MYIPNAYFTYNNTSQLPVDKIISLRFKSTVYEPVNTLKVIFFTNEDFYSHVLQKFYCTFPNNIIFEGIIDKLSYSQDRKLITAECRSVTSLLVDNQVRPEQYTSINSETVYSRYLQPFAVTGITSFPNVTVHDFNVTPGQTAWQAVTAFSKRAFDLKPHIDSAGKITVSPHFDTNPRIVLGSNNLPCSDVTYCNNRYNMLSNIHFNISDSNFNANYSGNLVNPEINKYGYTKRRYVNFVNSWNNKDPRITSQAIYERNIDQHVFNVTLQDIHGIYPGQIVDLNHDINISPTTSSPYELYVGETEFLADNNGIRTNLKLYDLMQATY